MANYGFFKRSMKAVHFFDKVLQSYRATTEKLPSIPECH
jgi:hypothetical protein